MHERFLDSGCYSNMLQNGVHDGKREFIGINSFMTGPVIVSNKNWNISIKWEVVIAFWERLFPLFLSCYVVRSCACRSWFLNNTK